MVSDRCNKSIHIQTFEVFYLSTMKSFQLVLLLALSAITLAAPSAAPSNCAWNKEPIVPGSECSEWWDQK